MEPGARTPEELETLLEDACVVRDGRALAGLFEPGGVMVAGASPEARGDGPITQCAAEMWGRGATVVAGAERVLLARDTALLVGESGVSVARRAGDGTWRFLIALLREHTTTTEGR